MAEKAGDAYVDIGARFDKLDKQLTKLDGRMNKQFKKSTGKIGGMFEGLGSTIVAAFSVGAIVEFQKAIISTTAEFQKFDAVLTNTLGSAIQAEIAFSKITEFAAQTPFSVQELTDAFTRLTNQGFQPSIEEMTKLGDLASSTGKTFLQLAEAIIDAQVGEFERLKEFGVRAQKEGDRVTFTFKGVQKQVEFSADAIQEYLVGLGDVEGVSGAASAISETLGGKINNLGDSMDNLYNTIGTAQSGGLVSVINAMASGLDLLNRLMTTSAQEGNKLAISVFGSVAKEGRDASLVTEDLGLKLAGATAKLDELKKEQQAIEDAGFWKTNEQILRQSEVPDLIAKQEQYIKSLSAATADYIQGLQKVEPVIEETATGVMTLVEQIDALEDQQKTAVNHAEWQRFENQIDRLTKKYYDFLGTAPTLQTPNIGGIDITKPGDSGGGTVNRETGMASGMKEATQLNTTLQETQRLAGAVEGAFSVMGDSVVNAFGQANTAAGQFLADISRVFLDLIAQQLAVSMANAITGATGAAAVAGPFAPAVLPTTIATMLGAVVAAFSKIPAFATGGQSRGGMALVGERGPELVSLAKGSMITPNHQMQSAMSYTGNQNQMIPVVVTGRLRGDDMRILTERGGVKINK